MKFRKYSSIDNSYRTKTINYIKENGLDSGEWVSTLKIHGSNYGLYTDGQEVKRAKRSGFIKGDKSFFGDYNFDYSDNALSVFNHLKSKNTDLEQVSIHGEIFGGMYIHRDVGGVQDATRVQKEVQYIPYNDFIVFDIKINNLLLPHDEVFWLCTKFGFKHVPVLSRGSFDDLLTMDVKFPDPYGELVGLPKIDDNFAEGWVMKPVDPKFTFLGERIILKGKNPDMAEKSKRTGKPPKPSIELSELGNVLYDDLLGYITEARLRNVLSHGEIENITAKSFGKLLGLFAKDIFEDFYEDNQEEFDTLEKKEQHKIKKDMNKQAGNEIRKHFLDIIDGEF